MADGVGGLGGGGVQEREDWKEVVKVCRGKAQRRWRRLCVRKVSPSHQQICWEEKVENLVSSRVSGLCAPPSSASTLEEPCSNLPDTRIRPVMLLLSVPDTTPYMVHTQSVCVCVCVNEETLAGAGNFSRTWQPLPQKCDDVILL